MTLLADNRTIESTGCCILLKFGLIINHLCRGRGGSRKANWIDPTLRTICPLKHVIKGKSDGNTSKKT